MKRTLSILLLLLSFWGAARFSHHQTKGFRIAKIERSHSPFPDRAPGSLDPEMQELFSRPFTYLGRGFESFAFLSEDGQFVLKLFNNRCQTRLFWLSQLPARGPWKSWHIQQIEKTTAKLQKAFTSFDIAYTFLREETGLLHLAPSGSPLSVTLIDPIGISHRVNLQKTAFAIQKKVEQVYPFLSRCDDEALGGACIQKLVSLLRKKMELGISDSDPLIRTNFGFQEGKAIQIDIGPLFFDPGLKEKETQNRELAKITLSLRHYLENHDPRFLPYLEAALTSP